VLREGVTDWLTAPPLAARVMAFASARPEDGGSGATYVLLRRVRER
jgi:DNA-nicking Smr family endonuclease